MTHVLLTRPADLDLPAGPLAVDTEFHAEKRYTPSLHLIQVRAPTGPAWLIDPHIPGMLEGVAAPLLARAWIVHAGKIDLNLLERALGGVPAEVLDTQIAAGIVSSDYPSSLANLIQSRLGIQLDKSETLSDWSRRPLSTTQRQYAASDVEHLHALWEALEHEAADLGREETIREASASARDEAIAYSPPDDAWLALQGRRSLTGERAVVLRELAGWREQTARDQNQPPMAILGNRVLFDLAKRRPATRESLLSGRRAPRGALSKHADELLERISRASGRPDWARPRTCPRGSLAEARFAWLQAFAIVRAHADEWSARLVLPDQALEAIAHGDPPSAVLNTWQRHLVGPDLDAMLAGERGLDCPAILA